MSASESLHRIPLEDDALGLILVGAGRTFGHSSSAFTADQRSHDIDEAAVEAADRIGAVLHR